ncbi:MAG: DNA polymerase III subunit delta [Oscillospiraceae bacterium]|nr:DNA polymerase III subunit delta [Oscillospiraceae bacterium]
MADKKDLFVYSDEKRKLRSQILSRLYLLYGPEEYLKEVFTEDIRKAVIADMDDGFSYKKFCDTDFGVTEIIEAVNAFPFLSDHTLVEIHDFDLNKYGEQLYSLIIDIPDYCTVVFVQNSEYTPDFRLRSNKYIREHYAVFNISVQSQSDLKHWIIRRFAAEGKTIDNEAAEQLIFVSGSSMNGLIPEIIKIASAVKAETVRSDDVVKYAHHLPEADVFEMVECLSQGKKHAAVRMLAELLDSKSADPIQLLSILSSQYKRLYAAKTARKENRGYEWLAASEVVRQDQLWLAKKLFNMRINYSSEQLEKIICILSDADYSMKTGKGDNNDILKEAFIFLTGEVSNAEDR